MSDLAELIAKLESASEGSHALDKEIAPHVGWTWGEEPYDLDEVICIWRGWRRPDGSKTRALPIWSCSLDGALTLVPKGWCYEVAAGSRRDNARAEVWDHSCGMASHRYYAKTGPLALCIAALKARSAA